MIPQVTAAALVSENKQRAYPASVDSIPTSANQEDHVSMAAHGARRLMPMAANVDDLGGEGSGSGGRVRQGGGVGHRHPSSRRGTERRRIDW